MLINDRELEREYHPAAQIFPLLDGDEFQALAADIDANGQLEPIWLTEDGCILDGRNRHRACIELGLTPTFRTYTGDSPTSFVVSLNLHRRHLSASQRAALAVSVLPILEEEARQRQAHGQTAPGRTLPAIVPEAFGDNSGDSRDAAASMFSTSPRYVSDAKRLAEDAPDLFEIVRAGDLTIPKAKEIVAERNGIAHVAHNSGNDEWYTPPEYIEAARRVMGCIDVDPASSDKANETVQAARYYTADDDGLARRWVGRVWLNPPYSQPLIGQFIRTLREQRERGNVTQAIVLTNNATETAWFGELDAIASAICLVRGRIKFLDSNGQPKGAPLQGQVIVYSGDYIDRFTEHFGVFGPIYIRSPREE